MLPYCIKCRRYFLLYYIHCASGHHSNVFCPVDVSTQPGGSLPDLQTTETAVNILHTLNNSSQPFFLAVGLHKPHIPHKFPQEYLQYHPLDNISLPDNHFIPSKLPSVAWNPYTSLREGLTKINGISSGILNAFNPKS